EEALTSRPVVFETMHDATLFEAHNEILFHTWGDDRCCLPRGATRATLRNDGERLKNLKAGDVLVLIETRNPQNGEEQEADPSHRHAVRLTEIKPATDPLFNENGAQPLRVLNVAWDAADALPFPLCLWEVEVDGESKPVSVALGNIVLADHGQTIADETLGSVPASNPALDKIAARSANSCQQPSRTPTPPRFRPRLGKKNLTHAAPFDPKNPPASASATIAWPAAEFLPDIKLKGTLGGNDSDWFPKRDLLSSGAETREFVVETESDGTAFIRFGDDQFGARPASGASFTATYRVGNGPQGNVGAGVLAHVVSLEPAIVAVTNPLAARGGTEPESIERVRQDAPVAFRTQERAVTPEDYAAVAERHAGVQRAAATMRWTGSWRTVFLTVDRVGGLDVDEPFKAEMLAHLERFRMAGHDVEVDGPLYVPLEIELSVCVEPGYFRGDVRAALLELFSRRTLPDGRRAVFHPDNYTFGQTVYLSPIYAAAQSVEGVSSVVVTKFARQGVAGASALQTGKLEVGRLEIARLDNDPDFPDRGVLRLVLKGGR
ncbi:MAG TPA: putative baseplate assembly protein, partial [Pyrinomonadaceae bacterium]|nr:putative baseplate assembly protein [Pyrinomonadaceae bacterium]